MTRNQFKRKYKEIAKEAHAILLEKGEKALKAGCLDLEGVPDNYATPKAVLVAALEDCARKLGPGGLAASRIFRRQVNNIKCFI